MIFLNISAVKLGKEAKKKKSNCLDSWNQASLDPLRSGPYPFPFPSCISKSYSSMGVISWTLRGYKEWKELPSKLEDRLPAAAAEEDQAPSPTQSPFEPLQWAITGVSHNQLAHLLSMSVSSYSFTNQWPCRFWFLIKAIVSIPILRPVKGLALTSALLDSSSIV